MKFPVVLPPSIYCPTCDQPIPIESQRIGAEYFSGIQPSCAACGGSFDWWTVVLTAIHENFLLSAAFAAVGARSTLTVVTLEEPGRVVELRLEEHGVPPSAQILQVGYSPQGGGLFPLEIQGNIPIRHFIPSTLSLYPARLGPGPYRETRVAVLITWVPEAPDDIAWQNLVDAFHAYVQERFRFAVIPANVAVELSLHRLLTTFFERVASKDRVGNFLVDRAGYGDQLNVILPALLRFVPAPRLPDRIRGLLNELRKLRNDIAHSGAPEKPLDRHKTAEYLCAALFGFHYLRLIEPMLVSEPRR